MIESKTPVFLLGDLPLTVGEIFGKAGVLICRVVHFEAFSWAEDAVGRNGVIIAPWSECSEIETKLVPNFS